MSTLAKYQVSSALVTFTKIFEETSLLEKLEGAINWLEYASRSTICGN